MSAWEGSAAQEQWEREAAERKARVEAILRDNPSLTQKDAEEWDRRRRGCTSIVRCCVCGSPTRAEVVRTEQGLGVCACRCHTRGVL